MKINKNIVLGFYSNLGALFYAIAASDKYVRLEEFTKFINTIENEWSLDKTDRQIIISSFKNFNDNAINAQDCFDQFILYKEKNEHLFSEDSKHQILITANKIASSFANKNKSELILLAKLKIAFRNNN